LELTICLGFGATALINHECCPATYAPSASPAAPKPFNSADWIFEIKFGMAGQILRSAGLSLEVVPLQLGSSEAETE
jgi:hypothetical protein